MGTGQSKDKRGKKSKLVALEIADEKENTHTINVDEKLLISHSSVFTHLSKSGVLKKKRTIPLKNITVLGLQKILEFLETHEVTFENMKEALETLNAALVYGIEDVRKESLEYLLSRLDPSNVCELYEFAETRDLSELLYPCLQIIDRQTHEVLESSGFNKLELRTLLSITKRGNLALRSEFSLLLAIVDWGKQEMKRRGVNSDQTQVFAGIIRPLLDTLRCKTMSTRKHSIPEVAEAVKYILAKRSQTAEQALERQFPRHYCEYFTHHLEILECKPVVLSQGDRFKMRVDVLKGRVFFLGVTLAVNVLRSNSASAACLHVSLTATNEKTLDKKKVRQIFFSVSMGTILKFRSPLTVKENQTFSVELIVKLTGKISPLERKNEAEVFFSPEQDVAVKIFPQESSLKTVKCIFKELIYYS